MCRSATHRLRGKTKSFPRYPPGMSFLERALRIGEGSSSSSSRSGSRGSPRSSPSSSSRPTRSCAPDRTRWERLAEAVYSASGAAYQPRASSTRIPGGLRARARGQQADARRCATSTCSSSVGWCSTAVDRRDGEPARARPYGDASDRPHAAPTIGRGVRLVTVNDYLARRVGRAPERTYQEGNGEKTSSFPLGDVSQSDTSPVLGLLDLDGLPVGRASLTALAALVAGGASPGTRAPPSTG